MEKRKTGLLLEVRSVVPLPRNEIKKPAASYSRTGESRTTLGDEALDFRVRNGNGYDCLSMATGKKADSLGTKRTATHEKRAGSQLQVKSKNKLSRPSD